MHSDIITIIMIVKLIFETLICELLNDTVNLFIYLYIFLIKINVFHLLIFISNNLLFYIVKIVWQFNKNLLK